ncbi:MAG: gliding motility protein GldC [Flavobacteriaceae bacterium]|nr:MAG: gliding motility protein GldC [Flavobacteriaceae bacterium]
MAKQTQIIFDVSLDENHVPEEIFWNAPDGGVSHEAAKAILLSVWDHQKSEALRIDLWTKDMPMDDMKKFFHQIFLSMANTYQRACSDDEVSSEISLFAEHFAKKSGIKS